jgi:hypothetical protein
MDSRIHASIATAKEEWLQTELAEGSELRVPLPIQWPIQLPIQLIEEKVPI